MSSFSLCNLPCMQSTLGLLDFSENIHISDWTLKGFCSRRCSVDIEQRRLLSPITTRTILFNAAKHFAVLPNYSALVTETHIAHLYNSTLHNFSGRQATDLVTRGGRVYPDCLGVKAGCILNMFPVCHWATYRDKQTSTLTFSLLANSESPVNVDVYGLHRKNDCDLKAKLRTSCDTHLYTLSFLHHKDSRHGALPW